MDFATERSDTPAVSRGHDYTAEGLRRLADALETLPAPQDDSRREAAIRALQDAAMRIQQDPRANTHADDVRRAFSAAASVLRPLSASSNVPLQQLSWHVKPDIPLLRQEEAVRAYFRASADLRQRGMVVKN